MCFTQPFFFFFPMFDQTFQFPNFSFHYVIASKLFKLKTILGGFDKNDENLMYQI